jgi:hypothetical protein
MIARGAIDEMVARSRSGRGDGKLHRSAAAKRLSRDVEVEQRLAGFVAGLGSRRQLGCARPLNSGADGLPRKRRAIAHADRDAPTIGRAGAPNVCGHHRIGLGALPKIDQRADDRCGQGSKRADGADDEVRQIRHSPMQSGSAAFVTPPKFRASKQSTASSSRSGLGAAQACLFLPQADRLAGRVRFVGGAPRRLSSPALCPIERESARSANRLGSSLLHRDDAFAVGLAGLNPPAHPRHPVSAGVLRHG